MSRLRWHDAAVNLAAHPIAWPLARAIRRVGGVVRVPGLGMVINDAETAHDILTRDDLFTKNGHGSISESMTVLFGPSALGNMDGESHRVLRAKLAGVVSAPRAAELLSACAPAIATLQRELASGHTVDLVAWMRLLSGRITLDMLGIAPPAGAGDAQCLELVALGERIVSGFDLQPSRHTLPTRCAWASSAPMRRPGLSCVGCATPASRSTRLAASCRCCSSPGRSPPPPRCQGSWHCSWTAATSRRSERGRTP
jgi:cytochrome P450